MNQLVRSIIKVLVVGACAFLPSATSNVTAQQPGRLERKPQSNGPATKFASGNRALKIPLEIDNNLILMRVRVNNSKPLRLIFDTGASISLINKVRATELGLKESGQAHGDATGGKIQVSLIEGVSLSVPGAEVSNQTISSMPFSTPPGFEFDGVIGYDFINQFVVEIDYQKRIMNLYEPRTYTYKGRGEVIPLSLAGRRTPLARVKIILEKSAPIEALLEVDTGGDNTFVINSPFVIKHGLVSAIANTTQADRVGAGGQQKVLVGRVKAVQLGRFVLKDAPLGLSLDTEGAGASEETDGLICGEIFRRFKVILDYSRKRMILEPNKHFNDPYDVDDGD